MQKLQFFKKLLSFVMLLARSAEKLHICFSDFQQISNLHCVCKDQAINIIFKEYQLSYYISFNQVFQYTFLGRIQTKN